MTAAELIHLEIASARAISFERFMDLALYAPGAGYYTRTRDPFGIKGDFYTAAQLQPVFGTLIRQLVRPLLNQLNSTTLVELGAGRGEMAGAFADLEYVPIESGGMLPENFSGVLFANEFFDALPVHLVRRTASAWREIYITQQNTGFTFAPRTRPPSPPVLDYLTRYHPNAQRGSVVEVNLRARDWIARISSAALRASFVIIDYGYTAPEWIRHAQGTLMGYHRHQADSGVLLNPGERDITAHVAWSPLEDALRECGWRVEPLRTLASVLLDAGAHDQFASLFEGCDAREEMRRRLQLKTLLFGMGETFRVLLASKGVAQ